MRRITRDGGASVIPLERAKGAPPLRRSLEMGIDAELGRIFLDASGRYRMTADQAEEVAVSLMDFVHELRNGGRIG